MSVSPKLSVLIPTYNREDFLSNVIDSVLDQEFKDLEIIYSDKASTDRTYEILQNYARKEDKVTEPDLRTEW